MTSYFLDSSAAAKRYIVESGTEWVRQIAAPSDGHTVFVAQITSAEIISGLARQRREGHIPPLELQKLRPLINHHMRLEYSVIALSTAIIRQAEDLLVKHPLRAYDAVQLASALDRTAQLIGSEIVTPIFVAADRRLLAAAEAEGLVTDDPNRHG